MEAYNTPAEQVPLNSKLATESGGVRDRFALRYRMVYDPQLMSAILDVFVQARFGSRDDVP